MLLRSNKITKDEGWEMKHGKDYELIKWGDDGSGYRKIRLEGKEKMLDDERPGESSRRK